MLECVCSHSSLMHTKYTTAKLQPNVFTYDPWCDVGNIQLPFSVSVTKKDYFKYFYHEIEKDTENENKTSNDNKKRLQAEAPPQKVLYRVAQCSWNLLYYRYIFIAATAVTCTDCFIAFCQGGEKIPFSWKILNN